MDWDAIRTFVESRSAASPVNGAGVRSQSHDRVRTASAPMSASMFAAIKCQDDRVGERGARAEWAWECWQNLWVFRQGSEVWGELSRTRLGEYTVT